MPSVTQDHAAAPPLKKRRRDNDTEFEAIPLPLYADVLTQHASVATGSVSPGSDQAFGHDGSELFHNLAATAPAAKLHHQHHHNQHSPILVRKMMGLRTPTKRQRLSGDGNDLYRRPSASPSPARHTKSPSHPAAFKELQETDANNRSAPGRIMFNRCHICNRRPTKKSDLDDFADCQGCGQRTCFICIRQCNGWQRLLVENGSGESTPGEATPVDLSASITMQDADGGGNTAGAYIGLDNLEQNEDNLVGLQKKALHQHDLRGWRGGSHRERICSRCCVERGADGDVVCLGCLAFVEG